MRYIFFVTLFVYSLTGLSQIKISKEKNLDLTTYETYAVQKGQVISLIKEKEVSADSVFKTLQQVINYEMKLRGYKLTTDSTAQLIISYVFEEADEALTQKAGPLGQTPVQDPSGVSQSEQPLSISHTLIIEMEDAKTHTSLWTATCTMSRLQKDIYTTLEMTTAAAFRKLKKSKKK